MKSKYLLVLALSLAFVFTLASNTNTSAVVWIDAEQGEGCIVKVGVQSMQNPTGTCYNVVGDVVDAEINGQPVKAGELTFQVLLTVEAMTIHNNLRRYQITAELYDDANPPAFIMGGPFVTPPLGDETWTSSNKIVVWPVLPNSIRSVGSLKITVTPFQCGACQAFNQTWPVVFVPGGARVVTVVAAPAILHDQDTLTVTTTWNPPDWDTGNLYHGYYFYSTNNCPLAALDDRQDDTWPNAVTTHSYFYEDPQGYYHSGKFKAHAVVGDNVGYVIAHSDEVTLD